MTHAAFTPVVNAFRFYQDGSESGSTPLGAQDAAINLDLSPGDQIVHLRARVDETGGASGATTDDYGLQVDVNNA